MAKKPSISSKSKSSAKPEKQIAPKRVSSVTNWHEKLSTLGINSINEYRTCNVFIMVEHSEAYSTIIEKFRHGADMDAKSAVKCVSYENVLENIRKFSQDTSAPSKTIDLVLRLASKEASAYLDVEEDIPCTLMAELIKLQIICTLNEDAFRVQRKEHIRQVVDNELRAMLPPREDTNEGKKRKGKDKKAKGDKGKGKGKAKGKEKKSKSTVADNEPDMCDFLNDVKYKESEKLRREKDLSVFDSVEIERKHLFVVLIGFYDFELVEELFRIEVPITGIVELYTEDLENISEESSVLEETDISSQTGLSEIPVKSSKTHQNLKKEVLTNFWRKMYQRFDSESAVQYFDSIFLMTISASDVALITEPEDDDRCSEVFTEIGKEIMKTWDIIQQHTNYIRNLKICDVGPKPNCIPLSHFRSYTDIMNTIPPDCFSVPFLLYAVIEQICDLVPDPLNACPDSRSSRTASHFSCKKSLLQEGDLEIITSRNHKGIKNQVAEILNRNINCFAKINPKDDYEYSYDPKLEFKISNKPFVVHENNTVQLMMQPYEKISSKYVEIYLQKLQCALVLLWKQYPDTHQARILTNKFHLQNLSDILDLPTPTLRYAIHTMLFSSLRCDSCPDEVVQQKCSLQPLFPQRSRTLPDVQKLHISYNFVNKQVYSLPQEEPDIQIPYAKYLDYPNIYEAKNLTTYKWFEDLPSTIMIQELIKADQHYLCRDYRYCPFDDSIIIRYHNNVNEFGINRRTWEQPLRTPVSLREFCMYILHEESEWIREQERQNTEEYKKVCELAEQKHEELRQQYIPDIVLTDHDLIQPGSVKARILSEQRQKDLTPQGDTDKKGAKKEKKKGSKKDDAKTKKAPKAKKTSSQKSSKSKSTSAKAAKFEDPLARMEELDRLLLPVTPPAHKMPSLHCAGEEPCSFFAYDLSRNRLQLIGSTIVFHSQDGVKVTVDQTRLFRTPENISVSVCAQGHSLLLHYNQAVLYEPFTFHFCLSNETVVAFAKPPLTYAPEEKVAEKICRAVKQHQSKEQRLYFISEQQDRVLKCFNIPYITRRNLVLSEELMMPFLKQLSKRGIQTKFVPSKEGVNVNQMHISEELVESNPYLKSEDAVSGTKPTHTKRSHFVCETIPPKYACGIISPDSSRSSKSSDTSKTDEEFSLQSEEMSKKSRKSLTVSLSDLAVLGKSRKEMLSEIKEAVASHLPVFKICSSRLHKYEYVKRVKSYVEVQVGAVLKRIAYKPPVYKTKRSLKITKLIPVKLGCEKSACQYDLRVSLPSSLFIQSVTGVDKDSFYIRQSYLDKGPQCKNIAQEYTRTFLRNGNILIKRCDGNIDIFSGNGQTVHCDVPYLKVKLTGNARKSKKCACNKFTNLTPLHAHSSSLTKFQKYLQRIIHRLRKHLVDGPESHRLPSHRSCRRWKRNCIKDPDQVYLLKSSVFPLTKFSLVTREGNRLRITRSAVFEEKKYFTTTAMDYRYQEIYYGREDGTHSIINHEGTLVTQFPDGTRISSCINVAPQLLITENDDDSDCRDGRCNKQQQVTGEDDTILHSEDSVYTKSRAKDRGWVSVFINFKYEHPNYATVIYCGMNKEYEIILPNDVTLKATETGMYTMNIGELIQARITDKQLTMKSHLCRNCLQQCKTVLNVQPLYDKIHPIPSNTQLLRIIDSFNKIFVVNYNGKCYKNSNYLSDRVNAVNCRTHHISEPQALFLLTRAFTGCKFWDVNMYRKRVAKTKGNPQTKIEFTGCDQLDNPTSVQIKTFMEKPCHEKFLFPYREPTLMLTKFKSKSTPPVKPCYVARRTICSLPEVSKLLPIYALLVDIFRENAKGDSYATVEFATFLEQIVESSEMLRRAEEEMKKERLAQQPPQIGNPPISLQEKLDKWKAECELYRGEIQRKCVPRYFCSKYANAFYGRDVIVSHESILPAVAPITSEVSLDRLRSSTKQLGTISENAELIEDVTGLCKCKTHPSDQDICDCVLTSTVSLEESVPAEENNSDPHLTSDNAPNYSDKKIEQLFKQVSAKVDSDSAWSLIYEDANTKSNCGGISRFEGEPNMLAEETTVTVSDKKDKVHLAQVPVSLKPSISVEPSSAAKSPTSVETTETSWYETEIGKDLFDAVKEKIVNAIANKITKETKIPSEALVDLAAQVVFHSIMHAVRLYSEQTTKNDYVAAAATAIMHIVEETGISASEIHILLEKLSQGPSAQPIRSLHTQHNDTPESCNVCPRLKRKIGSSYKNTVDEEQPSGFDVYSYYSHAPSIVQHTDAEKSQFVDSEPDDKSLTLVFRSLSITSPDESLMCYTNDAEKAPNANDTESQKSNQEGHAADKGIGRLDSDEQSQTTLDSLDWDEAERYLSKVSLDGEDLVTYESNPDSMMVLYSAVSLKMKDAKNSPSISSAVGAKNRLASTEKENPANSAAIYEGLLSSESLNKCQNCIGMAETKAFGTDGVSESASNKSDSLTDFLTEAKALIREPNDIEVTRGDQQPPPPKPLLSSKACDKDAQFLKYDCCGSIFSDIQSIKVGTAAERRKVVRRSVGTLTQPGTTDSGVQTNGED